LNFELTLMSPVLERLIKLQEIETRAADAQRRIAEAPSLIAALDAKLNAAREALTSAKKAVADNQGTRRTLDRDLIAAQQRLSKYKEQLMAVKTNDEYHAMQHQIAAAEKEVGRIEELVIINMVEADEASAALKTGEAALEKDEATVARERGGLETDVTEKRRVLEQSARDRAALMPELDRHARELFDRVLRARQGIAVAPAVEGHCSICHVRLRPQVFNTIVRNEEIVQCDLCQRILYFAGVRQASAAGQAAIDAATTRQRDLERPSSS
jgi:predicted  nucleic acid-binding Zn-ribbon protein